MRWRVIIEENNYAAISSFGATADLHQVVSTKPKHLHREFHHLPILYKTNNISQVLRFDTIDCSPTRKSDRLKRNKEHTKLYPSSIGVANCCHRWQQTNHYIIIIIIFRPSGYHPNTIRLDRPRLTMSFQHPE